MAMAQQNLTLSTTQGVQYRPFAATITGLTTGNIEVLPDGAPGFFVANDKLYSNGLPYTISTVVLREYDPGNGAGYLDTRIAISAASPAEIRVAAASSIAEGRSLARYSAAGQIDGNGSLIYSVYAEDDHGAVMVTTIGGGTPTPTPSPTLIDLSLAPASATVGEVYSGTVTGITEGSALALSGTGSDGLTITGAEVSGTPTTAGAVDIVETLAGATNSPHTTSGALTVKEAAAPGLISGNIWEIDPADLSLYNDGAGAPPALNADIPTLYNSKTGLGSDKTSTNGCRFVPNASDTGLPGFQFGWTTNGNYYNIDPAGAGAELATCISGQSWTMHIVFKDMGSVNGAVFLNFGTSSKIILCPGSNGVGISLSSGSVIFWPWSGYLSGTHVVTIVSSATNALPHQTGTGRTSVWIDGACVGNWYAPVSSSLPANFIIGASNTSQNATRLNSTILYATAYPTTLSQLDIRKNVEFLMMKYAGVELPKKVVFVNGNSLWQGVGATNHTYSFAGQLINQNSLPPGSIHAASIGGAGTADLDAMCANELDELMQYYGAENCYLFFNECINDILLNGSKTADQVVSTVVNYLHNRQAAGWITSHIYVDTIAGTSTARPGYAKFPAVVGHETLAPGSHGLVQLPADYAEFAELNICRIDLDTNMGLNTDAAPKDYATIAGWYATVQGGGSGTAFGGGGDGVHRNGTSGYPGTVSAYPYWADVIYSDIIAGLDLAA